MPPEFDWATLLDLKPTAPAPEPSYCHPGLQICPVAGHGRGLVIGVAAAPGDLLFTTRAWVLTAQSKLQSATVQKLQTCPEAEATRFLSLGAGEPPSEPFGGASSWLSPASGSSGPRQPRRVDEALVSQILRRCSYAHHALDDDGACREPEYSGVWLMAALMNHSCAPNVQYLFFGDLLVCRALRALQPGEELLISYVSPLQPRHTRRKRLRSDFGFDCSCARCQLDAMVPEEAAASLLQRLDLLVAGTGSKLDLAGLSAALDALAAEAWKVCSAARWEPLKKPAQELFGRSWKGSKEEVERLHRLLCGSFLTLLKGAAFARQRLGDPKRSVEAYENCLKSLQEVWPGCQYHARWAADCALQAYLLSRGGNEELELAKRLAAEARLWHFVCYGQDQEVFRRLTTRAGWPKELLELAAQSELLLPALGSSAEVWEHTLDEGEKSLQLALTLPEGVEPGDVELDVAPGRVVAAHNGQDRLHLVLPQKVAPDRAPVAKFKRKGRRLILELPLA